MKGLILRRDELERLSDELHRSGKKVVFTNGCFDIIHPGHIALLKKAKELGDVLIVGINSDSSIKKIKGKGRPIFTEKDRAEVLLAIRYVDYVTIFSEETPLETIKAAKPDVLVKGGDWTVETTVGREFVESRGGKVVIVPYIHGYSTTSIIEKVLSEKP